MAWQKLLEPFAEDYARIAQRVEETENLDTLLSACDKPTTTNCYWATFRVSRLVCQLIDEEMRRRQSAKEQDDKATGRQ